MTSAGLNDGALAAEGTYPAAICCNLYNAKIWKKGHTPVMGNNGRMPFVTCRDDERFVADLCDDAVMGYKYFAFDGKVTLTVTYRGQGSVSVCDETKTLGELTLAPSVEWCKASVEITEKGTHALYLKTKGDTMCDILKLSFSR